MSCNDEVKRIVLQRNGLTFEMSEGGNWDKVYADNHPEYALCLGKMVTANGRFAVREGTRGIIVKINLPYEEGRTVDIIDVWFEKAHGPSSMKHKDLKFEWQK